MLLMLLALFFIVSAKLQKFFFCGITNLTFQTIVMFRNYFGISEKDVPPVRRGLLLFRGFNGFS